MIKAEIKDGKLTLKVAGEIQEIFAELICIIDGVSDTVDKKPFLKQLRKAVKYIEKHPLSTLPPSGNE